MTSVLLSFYVLLSTSLVSHSQPAERLPWPSCVAVDSAPAHAHPITADVREFIKHPDDVRHTVITFNSDKPLGMLLREKPHDYGEMVDEVQSGSQAWSAGVQRGWIITALNGKKLTHDWTVKDIATNVSAAQAGGTTITVKFDVRAAVDCLHASCNNSDRLPADTVRHCAIACERIPHCQRWSWNSNSYGYKLCFLHGVATEMTVSKGFSTGTRSCVPVPKLSKSITWPNCAISDADNRLGEPVYTDVRPFITRDHDRFADRHHDIIFTSDGIGMILREEPHDLGEIVSDIVPGSQAAKAGVQAGWIIREVNHKPFTKKENLFDINAQFEEEKKMFDTITVLFDVKSHADCTKGYCGYSDKFPASEASACADACFQTAECASWSFTTDEEDWMCYLRSDLTAFRSEVGAVVGGSDCSPAAVWGRVRIVLIVGLVVGLAVLRKAKNLCMHGKWKSDKLLD